MNRKVGTWHRWNPALFLHEIFGFRRFGPAPQLPIDRGRQLRRGGLICKYAAGLKSPLAVVRLDV